MNQDSNLPHLFAELSDLAAQLNQKSEAINKQISFIEDELRRLNIGLEVWSPEPLETWLLHPTEPNPTHSPPYEARLHLGFARRAGDWHLCVRPVSFQKGVQVVDPETRPISKNDKLLRDMSREVRIAALRPAALEPLLHALKAKVRTALQIIDDKPVLGG